MERDTTLLYCSGTCALKFFIESKVKLNQQQSTKHRKQKINQHILFILVNSSYEKTMFFLTWQSRAPSTHTINICTAILSTCTQKLSMTRPLMTERSEAPLVRTGLLSSSTGWKRPNSPTLELFPLFPSLYPLAIAVSLSLLSSPSVCLSQLLPVHSWGMSHCRGVRG